MMHSDLTSWYLNWFNKVRLLFFTVIDQTKACSTSGFKFGKLRYLHIKMKETDLQTRVA